MGECRIIKGWSLRGMRCLSLENDFLRVSIILDSGAKISHFIYKPSNRDFMWHNPRVEYRKPVYGTPYIQYDCSGWDECIPTVAPCLWKGEDQIDHGDFWALPWYHEIVKEAPYEVSVHVWASGILCPLKVDKWITLREDEKILHLNYKITNLTSFEYEYLWIIHPVLACNPKCRIDVPAGDLVVDKSGGDRLGKYGTVHPWPITKDRFGGRVDLRKVEPKEARHVELLHLRKLSDGWCSLTDTASKEGFGLTFPKEKIPFVWLWLDYGGWRDFYHLNLEPATGYPRWIDHAVKEGAYSKLEPGDSMECSVKAVIYTGISEVKKITKEGEVEG